MPHPPRNYLCVFQADPNITDDVIDLGLDPDFSAPVPTWGICRPPTRRSVSIGSYVVFIGHYKAERRYLVKGWIRVGEVIGYIDALNRFPNRRNVIISNDVSVRNPVPAVRCWKRKDLQQETEFHHGTASPDFLTRIHVGDKLYVQSPLDDHEIDNWKCQRMFQCREARLRNCIMDGRCKRELEFAGLLGYIVAAPGEWQDLGRSGLDWYDVAAPCLLNLQLRTPRGQHNARRLSNEDVTAIIKALANCSMPTPTLP